MFDVKGKIGIAVKRLKIKEFKTNHRILECGGWSFLLGVDGNVSGRRKPLWEDRVVAMEWILGRLRLR
jgi:hypothetical protein